MAVVGHVLVEEVILRVVRRLDGLGAFEERRVPLARVAADEAVEVFKAQPGRPQVERPGLAGLPVGDVVVLAVPGGVVAVLLQDLGERPVALRHERVVAGEARGQFHDDAGVGAVMVAPAEQRGARGRAQRRGVELVVAKAVLRQPVHRRRRDRSAERGRRPEAHVIGEDDEDVRRAFRRFDPLGEVLGGILGRAADLAAEGLFGSGQDFLRPCR